MSIGRHSHFYIGHSVKTDVAHAKCTSQQEINIHCTRAIVCYLIDVVIIANVDSRNNRDKRASMLENWFDGFMCVCFGGAEDVVAKLLFIIWTTKLFVCFFHRLFGSGRVSYQLAVFVSSHTASDHIRAYDPSPRIPSRPLNKIQCVSFQIPHAPAQNSLSLTADWLSHCRAPVHRWGPIDRCVGLQVTTEHCECRDISIVSSFCCPVNPEIGTWFIVWMHCTCTSAAPITVTYHFRSHCCKWHFTSGNDLRCNCLRS